MKSLIALLRYSFRRVRTLVFVVGLLLGAFQVFAVLIARSLEQTDAFGQFAALFPPFVRDLLGPDFAAFMSFRGMACLGYFHLAVLSALVGLGITLGTMSASEVESGLMDLMLSRPLARQWIVTRSTLVSIAGIGAVIGMMLAGTWLGLTWLAPEGARRPPQELVLSLAANLGLLALAWSGVAAAIGAASRRRGLAGAVAGLLALATFLMDYVARAWKPAETSGWFSPFRYFEAFELINGNPLPLRNVAVLAALFAAGVAAAYLVFSRRDISG